MQNVNYLGAYDALSELWSSFPEGGHEGDYALVGTTCYGWDKYQRTWVEASVSDDMVVEDTSVGNIVTSNAENMEDAAPEAASIRNVNYRGAFDTIVAAWMSMPNGGQEGDYIAVSGNQYSWDVYQRQWVVTPEEDVVPITSADLTLAAANSVDINYLGTFASIADVWAFYPEGGNEGEYVVVDDDIYSWDANGRQWVESENETITIAQLELSPSQYRINYLGAFDALDDVWAAYPEGGYEGDYIHLGEDEEITVWNKWGRNWGETGDPQTPAITSQTIPGSLTINYNLTVQGNIYGTVSNAVNASKWDNHTFSDYVNQALRTTDDVTFNKVTSGMFVKSGGTSSQFLKADGSVDSNTYLISADLGSYADSMAIVPATSIVLKHGNTVLSTLTKASLQELIGGGGTTVSWGAASNALQPLSVAGDTRNLLRPQEGVPGLLKADGTVDGNSYALASGLSSHIGDHYNPHQVTLAQVTNLALKITNICSWFDIDGDGNIYVTKNGNVARNFWAYGQIAGGGIGGGGGGGGTQVSWGATSGSKQVLTVATVDKTLLLAISGASGLLKADGTVDRTSYQTEITSDNKLSYSLISGTPSSLKNPYALTFGSKTYDGSVAKTVTASDLGAITAHQTVALASGTNNGTLKLTVGSTVTDNIAVKGLGSAAYKNESGTWAIGISGNAATATKLATARTIWGQSFDGSGNVSGALSGATTGEFSGAVTADSIKINGSISGRAYPVLIDSTAETNMYISVNNVTGFVIDSENKVVRRGVTTAAAAFTLGSSYYPWGGLYSTIGAFSSDLTVGGHITLGTNQKKLNVTINDTDIAAISTTASALMFGRGTSSAGVDSYFYGNNLFFKYGNNVGTVLALTSGGNVGVGLNNTTPDAKLHILADSGDIYPVVIRRKSSAHHSLGYIRWETDHGTYPKVGAFGMYGSSSLKEFRWSVFSQDSSQTNTAIAHLSLTGNFSCNGQVTAGTASDIRFKEHIEGLKDADSILASLRPVEFDWNELATSLCEANSGHDTGLIAQEVEEVMPQAVSPIYGDYKRVDYAKLTPVLVSGWQSHETQMQALRRENEELKERIANLERMIDKLMK